VGFHHDEHRSLGRDRRRNPRAGLPQQSLAAEQGAKLLRPVVAGNKSAQRFQARSVAASQNYAPELSGHCWFPPDVVFVADELSASWQSPHMRTHGSARKRSGAIFVEQRTQWP
jgi:hypothetical protein